MPDGSPAISFASMAARTSEVGTPGAPGSKAMIKGPLLSPAACGPHQPGCRTRRNSAPYELGQRTSFWVAAGVVAHTLWTSAAPAMTYPLFAEEWHLTHTVTTGVFAIYPIVVAAVLVGFGDVSDYVGRRAAILWGGGASLVGTL